MKKLTFNMLLAAIAAFAVLTYSCKNDKEETPVVPQPTYTISIESPKAGVTFEQGDTVHIQATITTSVGAHGWELNLINTNDSNRVVFAKGAHGHGTSYSIDEMWINDVHDHSDMKLEISVTKDHDGNKVTKEVQFHCHPH